MNQENESVEVESLTTTNTDVTADSSPPQEEIETTQVDEQTEGASGDSPTAQQTSLEAVEEALGISDEGNETPEPSEEMDQQPPGEKNVSEEKELSEEELYKMPEEVKSDKAKARFEKLVNDNKNYRSQTDDLSTRLSSINDVFVKTKCDASELSNLLDFATRLKSTDPKDLESAWQVLEETRSKLAVALGKTEAGTKVLPDYLQQKVDNYELSEADAYRLANADMVMNQSAAQQQAVSEQQNYQQQNINRVTAASQAITQLENDWAKNDPHYASKINMLMARAEQVRDNYAPEDWPRVLNDIYQVIPNPEANQNRSPNALRPTSIGAGKKVPRNSKEAVFESLGLEF